MWLDNLKALRAEKKVSYKQIADKEDLSERTVTRIFSGETENPSMDYLIKIVRALDGSLDDIFADTQAVVGRSTLAALQSENERLNGEIALISAENTVLKDKVGVLSTENEILRLKLDHKEEIIALHNYYSKLKAIE